LKKYLVINPFGIGDVLFTTPVVRALKESSPESFVAYWCNERVAPILRINPHIYKVYALSRGDLKRIYADSTFEGIKSGWGLFTGIRQEKFDISLDFSLEHRYSLLAKFAGIRRRVGFNYRNRGRFLTDRIELQGYNSKHVVDYYLDLLTPLGITPQTKDLEIGISDSGSLRVKSVFASAKLSETDLVVGIVPGGGASWGKDAIYKHWPALKFAQLADTIIDNLKAKIIILGDGSEEPISEVIVSAMKNKAINMSGKTTLDEMVALIDRLDLLITNDAGPLHIAAARGVKTVSIFGPVDEKVYGPYPASNKHVVIKEEVNCRPCYQDFRFPGCINNKICIKDISMDKVYSAVEGLI